MEKEKWWEITLKIGITSSKIKFYGTKKAAEKKAKESGPKSNMVDFTYTIREA